MKVSIITPVLDGEAYIQGCLTSIRNQTHEDWEHIVVDGGSTDRTLAILSENEDRRRTVISEKDRGMYDALNKGFRIASGQVFAYLNIDDFYQVRALEAVSKIFSTYSDVSWICGYPSSSRDGVIRRVRQDAIYVRKAISAGLFDGKPLRYLNQESMFWRSSLHREVGGFPEDLRLGGDFWLWTRFSALTELVKVNALLATWGEREGQLSGSFRAEYMGEVKAVQERDSLFSNLSPVILRLARYWRIARPFKILQKAVLGRINPEWLEAEEIIFERDKRCSRKRSVIPLDHSYRRELLQRVLRVQRGDR